MKKASNILYLVGSILCFVAAGSCLVCGLVFSILGAAQVFNEATNATPEQIEAANLAFLLTGIVCLVMALPTIAAGIVGLKARPLALPGNKNRGIHIAAIVLGAVVCEYVLIAGAVLALILSNRKPLEKEAAEAEVVE